MAGSASDGAIHSLSESDKVRFIEVMWSARLGSAWWRQVLLRGRIIDFNMSFNLGRLYGRVNECLIATVVIENLGWE